MFFWISGAATPDFKKAHEFIEALGALPPTTDAWTERCERADWILEMAEVFDTLAPTDPQLSSSHPPAAKLIGQALIDLEDLRAAVREEGDFEHLEGVAVGTGASAIRLWNFHFCEQFEGEEQNSMTRLYEIGALEAAGFTVS